MLDERLTKAKESLAGLLVKEEDHWKQRAKAHWLTDGDLNTRFFLQVTSARKKRNKIIGLSDDSRERFETQAGVKDIIRLYFTELFTASESFEDIDRVISLVDRRITHDDVTMLEAEAISHMRKDKSPGPTVSIRGSTKSYGV